jgi:hypothetical protein
MPEPLEGVVEDQSMSFPELHRCSRRTQPHSLGHQILHGQTMTWSADLPNTPLCDETRTTSARHHFDTRRARAVLERQ